MTSSALAAIDLGKSRCRLEVQGETPLDVGGPGAPGLAAADGVEHAVAAILPLLRRASAPIGALGVGAAGAWAAPEAAAVLAARLTAQIGAPVAVASDVVTAHAGALGGAAGVLLIAGTGAAALGVAPDGARLVDGWGPELGDLGSGSWLGREALRAMLREASGSGPATVLSDLLRPHTGDASGIQGWLAEGGPLARRLATLAPFVLDAASEDAVAAGILAEAVRLLAATARDASIDGSDVTLHGGLTQHTRFREALSTALQAAGLHVVPARGDALDGARLLARRTDLPHERFTHRAE